MDNTESVDFDFFDTPRNNIIENLKNQQELRKSATLPKNDGRVSSSGSESDRFQQMHSSRDNTNDYDSDDKSSSYTSQETSKCEREPRPSSSRGLNKNVQHSLRNTNSNRKRDDYGDSGTESSSACSNSDYSSNETKSVVHEPPNKKKENLTVNIPKPKFKAWGQKSEYRHEELSSQENKTVSYQIDHKHSGGSSKGDSRYVSSDSENESNNEPNYKAGLFKKQNQHDKEEKKNFDRKVKNSRKSLRSASSPVSCNSDITDVSPLDSPDESPNATQKRFGKYNGKCGDVQYIGSFSQKGGANIKLETEQIDLSILMHCMKDIEKQEILKSNSRHVMFAPIAVGEKAKSNYSFSENKARLIEKENQRLLKQIMNKMQKGSNTKQTNLTSSGPKKATELMIQRITPSAVNRMRQQRRIESENMMILKRLQTVRPSPGMTKMELLTNFERQMGFGIPTGTVVIPSSMSMYVTTTQRSRPSSAKSSSLSIPDKRSRPSSAKSNTSLRSNASLRSNCSERSIRSNTSAVARMADDRVDYRPAWDDRFAYS